MVEREVALKTHAGEVRGIPVSMGNPHYVVFVPEFAADWRAQAAEIQSTSRFQQGVNVEFVVVDGRHDVRARFFERGVGETKSSGTGSCASAVAAMATGRADSPVKVHAPGGTQSRAQGRQEYFLARSGAAGMPGRVLTELEFMIGMVDKLTYEIFGFGVCEIADGSEVHGSFAANSAAQVTRVLVGRWSNGRFEPPTR